MEKLQLSEVTRQMLDEMKFHESISATLSSNDYENYLVIITRTIGGYLYTYLNSQFGVLTTTFVEG